MTPSDLIAKLRAEANVYRRYDGRFAAALDEAADALASMERENAKLAAAWDIDFRRAEAAERSLAEAREVIEPIGRMKLFPDDVINRTTLQCAIHLARAFLSSEQGGK